MCNILVVTGFTVWTNSQDGMAILLVFHEALWMGDKLDHMLVNPNLFKYTPKGCKNQIVMAGRLLATLDTRPSTTSITTNNQDSIRMAPSTTTLVQGPYFSPKYQSEDRQQAQTPVDTTKGLWHLHLSGRGHPPLTVDLI